MADVHTGKKPKAATLLTGFETPLGRSAAVALARAGHRLCVIRSQDGAADQGLAELPGHDRLEHQSITSDLSDPVAVERAAHEAEARLGQITALVHVVPASLQPAPEDLDAPRFARQLQRGAGAFLGLGLALLPEMFATQTGCLCALTPAPAPGSSYASSELGEAALLGALLGAVVQLADRCAGTPLRSFLLHTGDSTGAALQGSALLSFVAQLSDLAELPGGKRSHETALLENGARASLAAPGSRSRIDLLAAPVVLAPPAVPADAARLTNGANGASGAAAATSRTGPDRIGERLAQTFRATFGLGPGVELASCVVGSVPRWDSLGHLKLMMEVERALRVRLPAEMLARIQSYRDLERAVRAQLSTL
jgi:acyl carrier protein